MAQGKRLQLSLSSPLEEQDSICQSLSNHSELHFIDVHDHPDLDDGDDGDDYGGGSGDGSYHLLGTDYAPAILLQTLHVSAPSILTVTV